MPRLHVIDPTTETGPGADLLNGPLKNTQLNIFKGIANNAGVLKAFLAFSSGVKNAGALTAAQHELIALAVGQKNSCDYCIAAHTQIGIGDGLTETQTAQAREGNADDAADQAVLDFTRAILANNGLVSDDDIAAYRSAGFGDDAIVETIAAVAVNFFTNYFNHVNQTVVDFPEPATV